MSDRLLVTPSPHLKTEEDIGEIMKGVCIALLPAFAFALYRFGYWSWVVTLLAVGAAVATEAACQRLRRRPVTVDDWSAVVTGLLLAAVLPPNVAWYVPVIGSVFAIGVAKQCFGGLGANVWNPALLGRAFLQAAFPTWINSGQWPAAKPETFVGAMGTSVRGAFGDLVERAGETGADIITSASPLEQLAKAKQLTALPAADGAAEALGAAAAGLPEIFVRDGVLHVAPGQIVDVFLGNTMGCIGEVSALALLLGGLYLLARNLIGWRIPLLYIATVAVLGWALPAPYTAEGGATAYTHWFTGPALLHVVGGGLFIGAFFMATDMVTSPMTPKGQTIFAVGCGVLTAVIRLYGGYPEGVCYSILLMNTVVPLIDAWTRPRVYGKTPRESATT